MILIVAESEEFNVPWVTAHLDTAGADYFRFDPRQFPSLVTISVSLDRTGLERRTLTCGARRIDLESITAAWILTRTIPQPDAAVPDEHRLWVSGACERWIAKLWECLECFWVPMRPVADRDPYRGYDLRSRNIFPEQPLVLREPSAHNKLHQLATAGRLGFELPPTLVTNSPDEFLAFCNACEGRVISKTAFKVRATRGGELLGQFTSGLNRRDVARLLSIRYAPVMFQEAVPKDIELRVTVVGRNVFAAAIRSQASARLSGDWRHYPEFDDSQHYFRYELPPEIAQRCIDLTAELGLSYGAIDLILTPDGKYVFLEINVNGQWYFIERTTGLPIAAAIARMLIDAGK